MTLAEYLEFVIIQSRKLEVEANAYITVFDGIKKLVSLHPNEPLLRKLCLTPDDLDGLLAQARNAPHLQGKRLSKYDSILGILRPNDSRAPTLSEVEKWLAKMQLTDLN